MDKDFAEYMLLQLKKFQNDWIIAISSHLLDVRFLFAHVVSHRILSWFKSKTVIDFYQIDVIVQSWVKQKVTRISLTIQVCFIKTLRTYSLLILLIQYLDSILNTPAGRDDWNVSLSWEWAGVVV